MLHKSRPPLWGNFVSYADEDILSIGMLCGGGLYLPAFYHATQAVEKYLKALILSIIDPNETELILEKYKFLKTHNLLKLASRCESRYMYYADQKTIGNLIKFSEYDQATRYPWVKRQHGNGFSSSDFAIFEEILIELRSDIPIDIDDYKLGIAVRGYHFASPDKNENLNGPQIKDAVGNLRKIFIKLDQFVRWPNEQCNSGDIY